MTARRRGAWCSCARSQGASAGSSPARCVTAKVSAWTVRAAKLAIPNRRWQSGHAGDRRYAWLTVWNGPCRCGTTTPAPYREVRSIGPLCCGGPAPGPAPCVWPADYLGGSPTLAILDALAVEGETTQVLLPAFGSSQPARETIVEANARSRPNGPCGRPEAEAPQRSVGQGTPSLALSRSSAPTSRAGRALRLNPENSVAQLRAQHGIAERGRWPFPCLPD